MVEILVQVANMVNDLHDFIWALSRQLGLPFNDKDLHFWVIGLLGVFFFIFIDNLVRRLAKYNISLVSFIFTFTILVILVLSLEVQQKIMGRGDMELQDIVSSLWGFLVLFGFYLVYRLVVNSWMRSKRKHK